MVSILFAVVVKITANEQGLLSGLVLLLVLPGTAAQLKTNVQVKLQRPTGVCPARMMHTSELQPIGFASCQPCSKPHVSYSAYLETLI